MRIVNSEKGVNISLSDEEQEAMNKAHNIVVEKFAAAGEVYGYETREAVEWCLLGALRIGGIPEMMRYVTETPIKKKGAKA